MRLAIRRTSGRNPTNKLASIARTSQARSLARSNFWTNENITSAPIPCGNISRSSPWEKRVLALTHNTSPILANMYIVCSKGVQAHLKNRATGPSKARSERSRPRPFQFGDAGPTWTKAYLLTGRISGALLLTKQATLLETRLDSDRPATRFESGENANVHRSPTS